jgi:hypothetical protein
MHGINIKNITNIILNGYQYSQTRNSRFFEDKKIPYDVIFHEVSPI